jgi:hypothetical protein
MRSVDLNHDVEQVNVQKTKNIPNKKMKKKNNKFVSDVSLAKLICLIHMYTYITLNFTIHKVFNFSFLGCGGFMSMFFHDRRNNLDQTIYSFETQSQIQNCHNSEPKFSPTCIHQLRFGLPNDHFLRGFSTKFLSSSVQATSQA